MQIVVYGCGGHARSVIDVLCEKERDCNIFLVDENAGANEIVLGFRVKREYELMDEDYYIVAIGDNSRRETVYKYLKNGRIGKSISVISKTAHIGLEAEIGCGTFVASGVHIGPLAKIGENTIINTGSIIEHETTVGNHVHIAPGVTVCGRGRIGNNVFCGAGSTVIDKISICDNVVIGAGAVVRKDITESGTYVGVPAVRIN